MKLFLILSLLSGNCQLVAPDSLTTTPLYWNIFQGDTVTFTTYGGQTDSSSWFALYGEECCVTRLDSNKTGVFTFVVNASDIFYSRIESYCDTTWGVSIDIDAYPRVAGIPLPASPEATQGTPIHYNLLGQEIPADTRGLHIIRRKLFLK